MGVSGRQLISRIGANLDGWLTLSQPEGRISLSGGHLSALPSRQEGAVFAARQTVADITAALPEPP